MFLLYRLSKEVILLLAEMRAYNCKFQKDIDGVVRSVSHDGWSITHDPNSESLSPRGRGVLLLLSVDVRRIGEALTSQDYASNYQ